MSNIFPATAMFLARLQQRPEVLGAYLIGSKSRGFDDVRSDDDVEVILTKAAYDQLSLSACVEQYFEGKKLVYDVRYLSIASLQWKQSSLLDADHWPYQEAKVLFDRNGSIYTTIQAVGCMDAEFRSKRIRYSTLSTTIAIGKAYKAFQRGYEAAGRMTIARGVKALSRLIFSLEWHWTPPDHWLEKEVLMLDDAAHVGKYLIDALITADPLLLRMAIQQLEERFPNDVPDQKERARLYSEIMHVAKNEDRRLYLLL